jgi:hypothetical protein
MCIPLPARSNQWCLTSTFEREFDVWYCAFASKCRVVLKSISTPPFLVYENIFQKSDSVVPYRIEFWIVPVTTNVRLKDAYGYFLDFRKYKIMRIRRANFADSNLARARLNWLNCQQIRIHPRSCILLAWHVSENPLSVSSKSTICVESQWNKARGALLLEASY